uniref:Uncharacterized protein n=1 Tax=Anguilla anguilla TaxID=7936 RepID=A0A0E9WU41_ANGAN
MFNLSANCVYLSLNLVFIQPLIISNSWTANENFLLYLRVVLHVSGLVAIHQFCLNFVQILLKDLQIIQILNSFYVNVI